MVLRIDRLILNSSLFISLHVVLDVLDINIHSSQVPLVWVPFWVQVNNLPYSFCLEPVAKAP